MFQNLISILNFSYSHDDGEVITIGSIIWGIISRSFILMLISTFLVGKYLWYDYKLVFIFILWLFVAWPAYNKFREYNKRSDDFVESTLCGTCRHFEKSAQLCRIYDEHPTKDYIPCDGDNWEMKESQY